MTRKEITKLVNIATFDTNDDVAKAAMKQLKSINKSYHWCEEWDYLVMCDEDPEYASCMCNKGN